MQVSALDLGIALAEIAAARDERTAARAAAVAARTVCAADRAAIYVRVPTLGWRRAGSANPRNLPGVVPDTTRDVPRSAGELVDVDLRTDSRRVFELFRAAGVERMTGAAIAPNGEQLGFIGVFDAGRIDDPDARAALTLLAEHLGTVLERLAGTERFRSLAESVPNLIWITRPDGAVEWCNARWTAYTGLSVAATRRGGGMQAAVHPDDLDAFEREWERVRESDADFDLAYRLRSAEPDAAYRWHLVRAAAMRDGGAIVRWFFTATDIDERRREALASDFLIRASAAISASLDVDETLRSLVDLAVPELGDWCVVAMSRTLDGLRPVQAAHVDPARTSDLLEGAFPPAGTSITLPIRVGSDLLGEVAFGYGGSGRAYDERTIRTARELTGRAAAAIENARRYEREYRVAEALQRGLLPAYLPSVQGLRFHAVYRPNAEEANVGGDWYDAFTLPSGRVAISIGDVGGHGLEAAITMGRVREMIRTAAIGDDDPATILARVDDVLTLGANDTMITALVGVIDRAALTFRYASAGHPAPLLATADRVAQTLQAGDAPLGIGLRRGYHTYEVALAAESLLVTYTDGLLEFDHDLIAGETRILDAVEDERKRPSRNRADAIVERIISSAVFDDIAVLAVSIDAIDAPVLALTFDARPESSPHVRAVIGLFVKSLGLDAERCFDLAVAVGEAVNNVIEHAYADGTRGTFALRSTLARGRVVVEVEDRGRWRSRRVPGAGPAALRGRGIPLMRELCPDTTIRHTPAGTLVRLEMPLESAFSSKSP